VDAGAAAGWAACGALVAAGAGAALSPAAVDDCEEPFPEHAVRQSARVTMGIDLIISLPPIGIAQ
jgi:hypothetical protein